LPETAEVFLKLAARKPFSLHSVVHSHGWMQLAPFQYAEETGQLSYVDQLPSGRVVEYRIRQAGQGVGVEAGNLRKADAAEASRRITWMLGLDLDFAPFYKATRAEPKLSHVRRTARGRLLRSPTLFEDVVKTILTTNTLWAATKRMNANLIEVFGEPLPGSGRKAFPRPEAIAASREKVLRERVRVGYRAPALHQLAQRVAEGELRLEDLKTSTLPTADLRKELLKINGVGPYAAANLLLILGRSDFIPIDSWALKLVSHEWYRGKPVTAQHVERRFARWAEFKGLAFWFWDWRYDAE